MNRPRVRIGIIGCGEVGRALGVGLAANGSDVVAYDIAWGNGGAPVKGLGQVQPVLNVQEAVATADLVIAAVPGRSIVEAAASARSSLRETSLYADIASAHPQRKEEAARALGGKRDCYIDLALLSPPLADGLESNIYASGPRAGTFVALAGKLGLNTTPIGSAIGDAARLKLVRSVATKGIEALLLECLTAASRYGMVDTVLDSLGDFFDTRPFADAARHMVATNARHSLRRAEEAREGAELVRAAGISPIMAEATSSVLSISAGCEHDLSRLDTATVLATLARRWETQGLTDG